VECGGDCDVDDGIKMLLARLPSDSGTWSSLTSNYAVDVFRGIFLATSNRGFGVSVEVSRWLSDRNLEIGFDLYFDPPRSVAD
jgi:ribosomal protein L19